MSAYEEILEANPQFAAHLAARDLVFLPWELETNKEDLRRLEEGLPVANRRQQIKNEQERELVRYTEGVRDRLSDLGHYDYRLFHAVAQRAITALDRLAGEYEAVPLPSNPMTIALAETYRAYCNELKRRYENVAPRWQYDE